MVLDIRLNVTAIVAPAAAKVKGKPVNNSETGALDAFDCGADDVYVVTLSALLSPPQSEGPVSSSSSRRSA